MTIGISVNVGLNKVTSSVFHADPLLGCENDAKAMHGIAMNQPTKFDAGLSKLLIGPDATLENVVNAVKAAAAKLEAGDLFLFTFAGHGTFKVRPTATEETDKHDESIVLADHLLLDNSWRNELWPLFKPGVRAVAIADCCHSETALAGDALVSPGRPKRRRKPKPAMRAMAKEEQTKEMDKFPALYKKQLAETQNAINCSRIFLSACLDDQLASDGSEHGAFTETLLKVWSNGGFTGNYNELMDKIKEPFKNTLQTPSLNKFGNPDFSTERPFTI
jgi:hypothetical protein